MNPTLLNTVAIPLVAIGCFTVVRLRDRPGRATSEHVPAPAAASNAEVRSAPVAA